MTPGVVVRDVHSRLAVSRVRGIVRPARSEELPALVRGVAAAGGSLSICGARHSMGGQQFGADSLLLDTTGLERVLGFDRERGTITVEAGIQWPALITWLNRAQAGARVPWVIRQKQTGADRLTLGGALSANIHGRGLRYPPFVGDLESFVLVDATGAPRRCSRTENPDLFRLAVGGYGLFGVVASIELRLTPRVLLERVVRLGEVDELPDALVGPSAPGFVYGDFQFAIDPTSPDFLRRGVLAGYRVVHDGPAPGHSRELSPDDWRALVRLAHRDKREAFARYAAHYLATSGQRYWSDTHQLGPYIDDYHVALDAEVGGPPATEVITELFVPRAALGSFMRTVARDFRRYDVDVVYGTVRLVERDAETVLAWAREPWACVVFNIHTLHTPPGRARATATFRRLIDAALARGGTFYLTYHRAARRGQVERAYPMFGEFLAEKRRYDPAGIFHSDWYDHYRTMFGRPQRVSVAQ